MVRYSLLALLVWAAPQVGTAQSAQEAIFYIQTLDANGQALRGGTGFFVDNKGTGITLNQNFAGATTAQIITADSSVYTIQRITGEDAATGLVRFLVEGLRSDVTGLRPAGKAPAANTSITVWGATAPTGAAGIGSANLSLANSQAQPPYGQILTVNQTAPAGYHGGPAVANGEVVGIVAEGIVPSGTLLVDAQRLSQMVGKNTGFTPYAAALQNQDAYLKAMLSYSQENWSVAAGQFAQAKRAFPQDKALFVLSAC